MQLIRNTVGIINEIPPKPNTKFSPGLSNKLKIKRNVIVNNGIIHNRDTLFFLTKGNAKINNPSGIIKNWLPPQEAMPKALFAHAFCLQPA